MNCARLCVWLGSALGVAAIAGPLPAAPPEVTKVEPPGWWVAHNHNPVRVLITGRHLAGARVEAAGYGLRTDNVRVNASATHLFVDVTIGSAAAPGKRALNIVAADGETEAPFDLRFPLPRDENFQGFSTDDVIYQIMPDRFANGDLSNDDPAISRGLLDRNKSRHYHGGDLEGIIRRLPYLKNLGVTALWLTPWYDNVNHLNRREKYTPGNELSPLGEPITDYHGYGAVDFYSVEERFGDLEKLRELVKAARRHGIKVMQDQVANHTGPYHPWVTNPPTRTWFNGSVSNHLANTWQTWTVAATNPPPDKLRETLEGWFIDILPDLNQNDPEVATYLIQNSLWWIGSTGIDAVRQDTLPYVPRSYWARWTKTVKTEYPRFTILGEMWDGNPKMVAFFQGGRAQFDGIDSGIDTLFDFPLFYAVRDVFIKGEPIAKLSERLKDDALYANPRALVTFLGLHDVPRFMHEPGATIDGLKLAFTFLFTTRGTPLIYYGDEIAMRGGRDPDNRRDFPGGFPGDPRNAFEESGRTEEEQAVFSHVRKLAHLRAELEPLRRGDLVPLSATTSTCAFARQTSNAVAVVALNNGTQSETITVNTSALNLRENIVLRDRLGRHGEVRVESGAIRLQLDPRTAAIVVPAP